MRQRCTQLLSKGDFKQSLNQPSWYPSITTQDSIPLLFIYRLFPRYLMGLVSTRQEELINTNTVSLHCTFLYTPAVTRETNDRPSGRSPHGPDGPPRCYFKTVAQHMEKNSGMRLSRTDADIYLRHANYDERHQQTCHVTSTWDSGTSFTLIWGVLLSKDALNLIKSD